MDMRTVLSQLLKFELALRDLYRWLAEVFQDHREVSGTFYRLSVQEQAHANLVEYQKRVVHQNAGEFARVDVSLDEIARLIRSIEEFRSRPTEPEFSEAIEFAKRLEQSAAEKVHRTAMGQSNADVARLVEVLAGDDRRHLELLNQIEDMVAARAATA